MESTNFAHESYEEELGEHLSIVHYSDTFKTSSERVRTITFAVMLFSAVVFAAEWNTTGASWVNRRYRVLTEIRDAAVALPQAAADAFIRSRTAGRITSRDELSLIAEEYSRQRVERMFTEIPGLGIKFDVNDLGLFSGIGFVILMFSLLFCMHRESENLNLALFKVRRLYSRDLRADGESRSNFLYHVLAMGQIFTAPPTLSEWRISWLKRAVPFVVFCVPLAVQAFVVIVNYQSVAVLGAYSALRVNAIQFVGLALVAALTATALLYQESAHRRWVTTFHYINPSLHYIDRPSRLAWLKGDTIQNVAPLRRHLIAQLVERLAVSPEAANLSVPIRYSHPIETRVITPVLMKEVSEELERRASIQAAAQCERYRLLSVRVTSSVINGVMWELDTTWQVSCDARNRRGTS
jgi:hypothetical protein